MKNCFVTLISLTILLVSSCIGQKGKTEKSESKECDIDTMAYPTDLIDVEKERVELNASDDERLRFYCWNTYMGGTCPDYEVIAQYRTNSGEVRTRTFREPDMLSAAWVSNVYTIKKDDGGTFYIAVRSHRASSNDGYAWVDAYAIDGDSLIEVSVTDGSANIDDGVLPDVNYSISDWYYITNGEGYDWMYEYDKKEGDIYVPISEGDMAPREMTDRYLLYHFDGKRFVKKGEVGHHGLHPSLQRYKRLLSFFRTEDYAIRVDKMENGCLRYASWKSNADLSDKPELVIMGGSVLKDNNDDSIENGYLFKNEGVEYVVGYRETHHDSEGYDTYHEYLIVYKDGKQILKQERL